MGTEYKVVFNYGDDRGEGEVSPSGDEVAKWVMEGMMRDGYSSVDVKAEEIPDKRERLGDLVRLAEGKGLSAGDLAFKAGMDPDRLNNGGLEEVIGILLDEGDDADWVKWVIESE